MASRRAVRICRASER